MKDFHNYRFLLSLQRHYLGGLESDWIKCSTGFCCVIDPLVDPSSFTGVKFLHIFLNVLQRDAAGSLDSVELQDLYSCGGCKHSCP